MEQIIRKVYIVVFRPNDYTSRGIDLADIQGVYESREDAQDWIDHVCNLIYNLYDNVYNFDIVERPIVWRRDLTPKEFLERDKIVRKSEGFDK